ncbi:uncharacterized protein [Asterias amurensis]|uniref:uncharacterized protein n=1 Tax=Asterias amurensis TaxID=7602 RepID=UPI003AB8BD70
MAPSTRVLVLLFVLVLIFHLTESRSHQKLTRSSRRSLTRRTTRRATSYNSNTGHPARGEFVWWHIILIILGIVIVFALLYCRVRQCMNREPESDTPGIHTTRDQIQLRDHKTVNHFPNHYSAPQNGYASDGGFNHPPVDAMYPPPVVNSSYPPSCDVMYTPSSSPAPPSYGNVIGFHKEMIDEGAIDVQRPDQWEDDVNCKRKDFGVI